MIGDLNQRADILALTRTPDGGGGFTEAWSIIATVWVRLEPQSGDDVFGPDAVESRLRHRIVLRRYASLSAGGRVAIGSRIFRVHAVLDDGPQSPLMTLLCEELP